MKAASLILQFVIFFMIGMGFFLIAGNIFRFQSNLIKGDIIDMSSSLALSEMSANSISLIDSCKSCEIMTLKIDQESVAGYNPLYQLSNGVRLEIEPENKQAQSSMHNLYYSINYETNKVASSKTILLTYDRTNNNLVMK